MAIHSRRAIKRTRVILSAAKDLLFLFFFSGIAFAQDISGQINLAPPYPKLEAVKMVKKTKDSCADVRVPESLWVSENGGVQNVIVWLEGNFKKEFEPISTTFDQKACRFEPHVLIVPAGKTFQVSNSDPLAHDIRGFDGAKMLFRFEMGPGDSPVPQNFPGPGIYVLRCGFHTWMHAYLVSAPHAFYAVTEADGRFTLKNVPEGKYQIHVWHETLGEDQVALAAHGPTEIFSYTFKQH